MPTLTPTSVLDNDSFVIAEQQPSFTFAFDLGKKVMRGKCDGEQAIRQAIYLILFTDRYKWIIHDYNYGQEMASLFGKPFTFVIPEIERLVTEALTADDRIDDVVNFEFKLGKKKNDLLVTFTAVTNLENVENVIIEDFLIRV